MRAGIFALSMLLAAGLSPAAAQQPPRPAADTALRYQLERTDHGFIRLDRQTGAVSACREETTGLTCRLAADERAAWEQEIDRLDKRIAALERKIGARTAPTETEIEQSLSIMERFLRRFMDMIEEFRGHETPQPDRT